MDLDGNEQFQVGFNLNPGAEIFHQSTRGFIEEVAVVTHSSKVGHFAFSWHGDRANTMSSYYDVANENMNALDLIN